MYNLFFSDQENCRRSKRSIATMDQNKKYIQIYDPRKTAFFASCNASSILFLMNWWIPSFTFAMTMKIKHSFVETSYVLQDIRQWKQQVEREVVHCCLSHPLVLSYLSYDLSHRHHLLSSRPLSIPAVPRSRATTFRLPSGRYS